MIRAVAAVAIFALTAPAVAARERPPLQPAAAQRLIRSQGSYLSFSPQPHRFYLIGSIHSARNRYDLYYYDWTSPVSLHGRQAIIVVRNARIFVGVYDAPVDGCRIARHTLTCWSEWDGKRLDQHLVFPDGNPPATGVLGGDEVRLAR